MDFEIVTGWINFHRAFTSFQRIRDVYLLAEFEGLEVLSIGFEYDYRDGFHGSADAYNPVTFDLTGYSDSPAIFGGPVDGGSKLRDKKEWRFQPRQQQCSSVQLTIKATARVAKFDGIRFSGDWGRAIGGQSHQVANRP